MTPGKLYTIDGLILRCEKIRESGINTFQIVDESGQPVVVKKPGLFSMDDDGKRLIFKRTNELKEKNIKFYCQRKIEGLSKCKEQCEHCKEYYKPLQNELSTVTVCSTSQG